MSGDLPERQLLTVISWGSGSASSDALGRSLGCALTRLGACVAPLALAALEEKP